MSVLTSVVVHTLNVVYVSVSVLCICSSTYTELMVKAGESHVVHHNSSVVRSPSQEGLLNTGHNKASTSWPPSTSTSDMQVFALSTQSIINI